MARITRRKTESARKGRGRNDAPLRWYWRYSLMLAMVALAALVWMSLLTYSPDDLSVAPLRGPTSVSMAALATAPASTPAGRGLHNAAGIVGAHMAHGLLHYVGGGVYAAVLLITVGAVLLAVRGRIATFTVRVLGGVLLVVVVSSALYLFHPSRGDLSHVGSAGWLGVWTGQFLYRRLAQGGAWTVVVAGLAIAMVLTAGRLVITVPAWCIGR